MIDDTRASFKKGSKRPLAVLPCGAGKTICFADMAIKHTAKDPNNKVWFLVHRQELIDQTIETFEKIGVKPDDIFVGMIQTLSSRIRRGIEVGKPTLIIIDEAHHAKAKTWKRVIDHFVDVPIVGLTATPIRKDGQSLADIFDSLIEGDNATKLINDGWLADYDYYAPPVAVMEFKMKGIDYDLDDVTAQLLKSKVYGKVDEYIDRSRKTIVYCPSIKVSQAVAEHVGGVHLDGDTPKQKRRQIVKDFKDGKISILTNVDLIGEGFDVPDCDVVIELRPTQSLSLYIQQTMRALRPKQGKRATIYDLVGNVYRHGLPTNYNSWSLTQGKKVRNPSGDPDVVVRRCQKCLLVYEGTNARCPYCDHNNGRTRTEIETEERIRLEKIEKFEKTKARIEVGSTRDYESLVALGRQRGYKNPQYWAKMIIASRKRRKK